MNQERRQISRSKRIVFSLLAMLIVFGLLELGFRGLEVVRPPRDVDYGLGFNSDSRVFIEDARESGRVETHPVKRVSFVHQRFDRIKGRNVFRIVAIGGSSVNELQPEFVSLESRLTKHFRESLDRIEIINCGGLAYGSHRLVLVFREILEYGPDLVVLYSGHNEFEEVEQLQLSNLTRLNIDRAISHSAIVRFMRDRKADYDISQIEKKHNQLVLSRAEPVSDANYANAWTHDFSHSDVAVRMVRFEHNLRLILTLAREQQIPVVMGTVASNLLQPYDPLPATPRYEEVYELWRQRRTIEGIELAKRILVETPGRHQCSDSENEILRGLATEFSLPLVDVESLVTQAEPHGIPGETLFDDHCHLNAAGRALWITGYEPVICQIIAATLPGD